MIGALLLAAAAAAAPPGVVEDRVWPVSGRIVQASPSPRGVLVLVSDDPGKAPVRLLRVGPARGVPPVLAEGLPPRTGWVGTDGDDILVAGEGEVRRITPEGSAVLVRDPDLGEVTAMASLQGRLWTGLPQALVSYGPDRRLEAPLPAQASRRGRSLQVTGPPFQALPGLVAAGPVEADRRRLRMVVARPPEPAFEAWARLPGPEQLLEHALLDLDGRPLLVVTTMKAGKLEFFGEKLLRVFALEPDRTRQGTAPLFAVTSRMNLWQEASFHAEDVDGDGLRDLVVSYVKGMKDVQPALDAYRRLPSGGFDPKPRSTEIEIKEAEDALALYGGDLDGDGRADLVLSSGRRLLLYPGAGAGKGIVSRTPREIGSLPEGFDPSARHAVSVGSGGVRSERLDEADPVLVADVDGDGRDELVLVGHAGGHDRLALVGLPAAADAP